MQGIRLFLSGLPVFLPAALLILHTTAHAVVQTVPLEQLVPTKKHARVTEIILHVIDTYHYKNRPLDDALSSQILDNYLDSLDGNKSYFLRSDIARFEQHRYQFDEALLHARLQLAFDIFKVYRQRVIDRSDYARHLLKQPFDFSQDEDYQFDRRETDWAADKTVLDEWWRKRVKNDFLGLKLAGKEDADIISTLDKRYARLADSTVQLTADDIFQTFINAYTTAIEPHTAYFSPRSSENFDISMRLSLEGIGAVLRSDNDYTVVQKVIPGGPADLNGQLQSEDKIIGVGQEAAGEMLDVIGWRLDDVVDLIRGPKDSIVRLEVMAKDSGLEGPTRIIQITRDEIKLEEQAAKSDILELENGGRIGVIDVPTFYSDFAAQARGEKTFKSTSRDTRQIIADLKQQNIDGLIIDLRGNGGGSLSEALEFTGLFIEKGPIVQTRDAAGRIDVNHDPDPGIAYGGPLAVLVDRNSASASEIFSGAIQDYKRGIIVGEPTFGKGTVQNIVDLNTVQNIVDLSRLSRQPDGDYGRLKTTIAQFFRISGGSNQFTGVIPDIIMPTAAYGDEHGERALDHALPWAQIKPARYLIASAPVDSFSRIKKRHEARIENHALFQQLLADLANSYQRGNRKTISLLKSKRQQERETLLAEKHRLRKAFRRAQGLPPLPEDAELDDKPAEQEQEKPLDLVLQEAAQILADLLTPPSHTASTGP